MNDSVYKISLDIHEHASQAVLKAKKTDTGRKLHITLRAGGTPYTIEDDCYAAFKATKPDGTILFNACTIENNEIIYEFTEQTCTSVGRCRCEIALYGPNDNIITSPRFSLLVDGTIYPDEIVESADEFSALAGLITDTLEATNDATQATHAATQAAQKADQAANTANEVIEKYGEHPIKFIDNTKSEVKTVLHELPEGAYMLTGFFPYTRECDEEGIYFSNDLVSVEKYETEDSVVVQFLVGRYLHSANISSNHVDYEKIPLRNLENKENRVNTISKESDDEHYPTAKAVYDAITSYSNSSSSGQGSPDHSMYFDIDVDGIVSLKSAYRFDGNLNNELPEALVIPDVIHDIAVTGLTKSMFSKNHRIKSLKIPSAVTTIPRAFLSNAINLTEITGTENIEMIEQAAFQKCGIKKAIFPKLKTLVDAGHFNLAANLSIVDIGNEITSIPASAFAYCDRLSLVKGGSNVTSIGANAFFDTASLKNLPIVANAQSIGDQAFLRSRVTYDWWALKNKLGSDAFGTDATPAQYNEADWWSKCTTVPRKNTLGSIFHQKNPEWASLQIANSDDTYGDGGCLEVSASHIYSALGGKNIDGEDLKSPCEFIDVIRNTDESLLEPYVNPTSGKKSYTFGEGYKWFDALGFDAELLAGGYSAENLPNVYDALANGALVLTWINPGHAGVIFGIAENSEVLVLDSDSMNYVFNDFTPRIYQQPIWSLAKAGQDVMTVKRKEK